MIECIDRTARGVLECAVITAMLFVVPWVPVRADDGLPSQMEQSASNVAERSPKSAAPSFMLNGQIEQQGQAEPMQQPEAKRPQKEKKKHSLAAAFGGGLLQAGKGIFDQSRVMAGRAIALNGFAESDIGIVGLKFVTSVGRLPVVVRIYPSTPAAYTDIRPSDVIIGVDNVPTLGLNDMQVHSLIVGTPNTPVTIWFNRYGMVFSRTMMRMDFSQITDAAVRNEFMMIRN